MNKSKEVSQGLINRGAFRDDLPVYGVTVNSRGIYDNNKKMRLLTCPVTTVSAYDESITHFFNDVLNIDFNCSDVDKWGDFCRLLFNVRSVLRSRRNGFDDVFFEDIHEQLCKYLSTFTFSTDKYDLYHYTFSMNDAFEMTENRRKSCKKRRISFTRECPNGEMYYENSKGEWVETEKTEHRRVVKRRQPYNESEDEKKRDKRKKIDENKSGGILDAIRKSGEILDEIIGNLQDNEPEYSVNYEAASKA